MKVEPEQVTEDIARLRQSLGSLPEPVVEPALVIVSGLPGVGKSFFCRQLAQRMPFVIVESDALRKTLFISPGYSARENARLFLACHRLIGELLSQGIPVIFDATNLSERHREHLYHISNKFGARLVLVYIEAPPSLVYERLEVRKKGTEPEDKSDAGWDVYQRMKPSVERIGHPHLVVDTSRDITPVINKVVRIIKR